MGVRRVDQFDAFQLAQQFKRETYRVVRSNPEAMRDFDFKKQVFDAASGIESCMAEGFKRKTPGEFAHFIRYSIASLEEAVRWLSDGVDRRHYGAEAIQVALALGIRCDAAMEGLYRSQIRRRQEDQARRVRPSRGAQPARPEHATPKR